MRLGRWRWAQFTLGLVGHWKNFHFCSEWCGKSSEDFGRNILAIFFGNRERVETRRAV